MRFMNTPNGFELQTRLDSTGAEFQTALELRLEPFFMNTGTAGAVCQTAPFFDQAYRAVKVTAGKNAT